jgi:hypothetical protein
MSGVVLIQWKTDRCLALYTMLGSSAYRKISSVSTKDYPTISYHHHRLRYTTLPSSPQQQVVFHQLQAQ